MYLHIFASVKREYVYKQRNKTGFLQFRTTTFNYELGVYWECFECRFKSDV